jgi:hypothetical protein
VFLDNVKIVQEPFPRRAYVDAGKCRRGKPVVCPVENRAGGIESVQETSTVPPASSPLWTLALGQRPGALSEVICTEKLAADRACVKVLRGLRGTAQKAETTVDWIYGAGQRAENKDPQRQIGEATKRESDK